VPDCLPQRAVNNLLLLLLQLLHLLPQQDLKHDTNCLHASLLVYAANSLLFDACYCASCCALAERATAKCTQSWRKRSAHANQTAAYFGFMHN
jgi:hypothetical protein